jgi:tetratricopeptide (TPR) repeat protein
VSAARPLAVVSALTLFAAGLAANPPSSPPPAEPAPAPAVADLIRRLGADRYSVREAAQQALWQAGAAAEPALRAALAAADPEVGRRARAVLDKFEWGVYPTTPEPVRAQIERFRDGAYDARRQAVAVLAGLGPPGTAALSRIAVRPDLPDLLTKEGNDHVADFVAIAVFSGELPAVIARWEATKSERSAELLPALYRAKGDFAAARKAAANNPDLLHELVAEQGDWKTLAGLLDGNQQATSVAARVVCFRLAGDAQAADRELAALRDGVAMNNSEWLVARTLLLCERPAEALETLRAPKPLRSEAVELLAAQCRCKEALAVAAAETDEPGTDLLLSQARALYLVGERDKAAQQFADLASRLTAPSEAATLARLVQVEARLGLTAAARDHAAAYLATMAGRGMQPESSSPAEMLATLFPKWGAEAGTWWTFLRQQFPTEEPAATMKRLAGLLDPLAATKPADPSEFTVDLLASAGDLPGRAALAAADEAAGRLDAARGQLVTATKKLGTAEAWIKLGDFDLRHRQFGQAADAYAAAAKEGSAEPLPAALQGWALIQAGRLADGRALLDRAHVMPLGDVETRIVLAFQLANRGATEPARREWDLIERLGWGNYWEVAFGLARAAADRKDFARAAVLYDRMTLALPDAGNQLLALEGDVTVCARARAYHARAALAAGRTDEALKHARAGLDMAPGNVDVPQLVVPELDRLGRAADAAAIYDRAVEPYRALAREYPKSGHAHNGAAWLAAVCRRDLDVGLAHARAAVELEPHNPGFRDTLAEVRFQRGETAAAIDLMRGCLKAEPRRVYFARQLARFEAGDRSVPPPEDDD